VKVYSEEGVVKDWIIHLQESMDRLNRLDLWVHRLLWSQKSAVFLRMIGLGLGTDLNLRANGRIGCWWLLLMLLAPNKYASEERDDLMSLARRTSTCTAVARIAILPDDPTRQNRIPLVYALMRVTMNSGLLMVNLGRLGPVVEGTN
jgi:hypothetical protein